MPGNLGITLCGGLGFITVFIVLAEKEVALAVNGPLLQHADPLFKEVITEMFKDTKDINNRGGHFVKRNQNIKDFAVFQLVDSLLKKPKLKPFMY